MPFGRLPAWTKRNAEKWYDVGMQERVALHKRLHSQCTLETEMILYGVVQVRSLVLKGKSQTAEGTTIRGAVHSSGGLLVTLVL